ncbi:hypothetical protein D3C86_1857300 [compost metagenome]
MQQAVELAEFALDHRRQFVVLVRQGGFQVERDHRGLRVAGGLDGVVDPAEVSFGLAQQQHGRPMGGKGLRGGGANPAAGASDQNHPVLEQVGAGRVLEHEGLLRRAASLKRQAAS